MIILTTATTRAAGSRSTTQLPRAKVKCNYLRHPDADTGFYGNSGWDITATRQPRRWPRKPAAGSSTWATTARSLSCIQQIEDELRTQYVASYTPSNAKLDGTFRHIAVECRGDGMKVQVARATTRLPQRTNGTFLP